MPRALSCRTRRWIYLTRDADFSTRGKNIARKAVLNDSQKPKPCGFKPRSNSVSYVRTITMSPCSTSICP